MESVNRVTTDKLHAILPHVQQKFIKTNLGEKPSQLLLLAKKLHKSKIPTIIFWYLSEIKLIIYYISVNTNGL